jgi:hypothetical protein
MHERARVLPHQEIRVEEKDNEADLGDSSPEASSDQSLLYPLNQSAADVLSTAYWIGWEMKTNSQESATKVAPLTGSAIRHNYSYFERQIQDTMLMLP